MSIGRKPALNSTRGSVDMVKNPAIHQKVMDSYSLLRSKVNTGDATTRAHYQSLVFKIKQALTEQ